MSSSATSSIWIGARPRRVPGTTVQYELYVVNNDTYEGMRECPAFTYPPMHNAAEFNIPRSLLEEYIELAEEFIDMEEDYDEDVASAPFYSESDIHETSQRMETIEAILGKLVVARDAAIRRRRQAILAWAIANE